MPAQRALPASPHLRPVPSPEPPALSHGKPVYTNDGFHLGFTSTVDKGGRRFCVYPPGDGPAIYVSLDSIGHCGDDYVVLCRTRAEVREANQVLHGPSARQMQAALPPVASHP